MAPTFPAIVRSLAKAHAPLPKPVSKDPFHLILLEQVAYLAPYPKRLAAFRRLKSEIGLTPANILTAPIATLRDIAKSGGAIAFNERADRMRESARIVRDAWDGDLQRALALPLPKARKALGAFRMIGAPGADRILALCGAYPVVGLDSNALRVMQRLGFGTTSSNYNADLRSVMAAIGDDLPTSPASAAEAAAVLRVHGESVCKRTTPHCAACVLSAHCPSRVPPTR